MKWNVKMWNGECDDMRKILNASWSWQEFNEFLCAYSDTLYDKHKIKTNLAGEWIEDEGYGMNSGVTSSHWALGQNIKLGPHVSDAILRPIIIVVTAQDNVVSVNPSWSKDFHNLVQQVKASPPGDDAFTCCTKLWKPPHVNRYNFVGFEDFLT